MSSDELGNYKVYPAYKDSDVDWLGDVPVHWHVERQKYAAPIVTTRFTGDAEKIAYIALEHIESWTGKLLSEATPAEVESSTTAFRSGDVLFGKLRPYLAKVLRVDTNGHCSTELVILRSNGKIKSDYLAYQLRSEEYINWLNAMTYGTKMPRANPEQISNIAIAIPPLPEQQAIGRFLDHKTSEIDALIAAKQRLIILLQEKRAALITYAVTKGLNPTVLMKDSGIEWLGRIPAHWEVVQLKRLADIAYGLGGELDSTIVEGTPIISLPNVSIDGRLDLTDTNLASLSNKQKQQYLLDKGDLLFNWRNGSSKHVGKTALFDEYGEYTHVSFLLRIRFLDQRFVARFFQRYLNSLRFTGFFLATKAGVNNTFNQSELRELSMLVPPLEEQIEIDRLLNTQLSSVDTLLQKVQDGIEHLQEYRTALISSAVTGKIDVRDYGT